MIVQYVLTAALFLALFARPAYAYLDPATSSMIFQSIIATVLAVFTTAGIYWRRIKSFFSRDKEKKKAGSE